MVGKRGHRGIPGIMRLDGELGRAQARRGRDDGLVEFSFEVDGLALIRGFARRDSGKIPDDRGHPFPLLDDVLSV